MLNLDMSLAINEYGLDVLHQEQIQRADLY